MKWLLAVWVYILYLYGLLISWWKKPRAQVPFVQVTSLRVTEAAAAPTIEEIALQVPSVKESAVSIPVKYRTASRVAHKSTTVIRAIGTDKEAPTSVAAPTTEVLPTRASNAFLQDLESARVEKDVDSAYSDLLKLLVRHVLCQVNFSSGTYGRFTVDNTFRWKAGEADVFFLMEDKFGAPALASSLLKLYTTFAQAVIYQKKLQDAGHVVTSIALADEASLYMFPGFETAKLLSRELQWNGPANAPHADIQRAVASLVPFPEAYRIVLGSNTGAEIVSIAADHVAGVDPQKKVTTDNLAEYFEDWLKWVAPKTVFTESTDAARLSLLTLFRDEELVFDEENCSMTHRRREFAPVSFDGTRLLYAKYSWDQYNEDEKQALNAAADSLIDPEQRKRLGAFYTPIVFANHGWQMTQGVLREKGKKWNTRPNPGRNVVLRESDVIVWDPAAGSGNLIRAPKGVYKIATTLAEADAAMLSKIDSTLYTGALDFLNYETLPVAIDGWLKKAAKAGSTVVFLMNPPYAEDGEAGADGDTKAGVADTRVGAAMRSRYGRAARQLYAQFMFRVAGIIEEYSLDAVVALYSKPTFMCSDSYKKFRDFWYTRFSFERGFVCQASAFNADLSDAWGISFTAWTKGNHSGVDNTLHVFGTCAGNLDGGTVAFVGEQKTFYSLANNSASDWILKGPKGKGDTPKFSSGLSIRDGYEAGQCEGSLGVFCNMGNNLVDSGTGVMLLSGKPTHRGRCHVDLLPGESFNRAVALFAARKLVTGNWLNDKDEYLVPDTSAEGYEQWNADAVVYALLHPSNNCTAMRKVMYKGTEWTIDNHFFWYTKEVAGPFLADYPRILSDLEESAHAPHVATLLTEGLLDLLSEEAFALLTAVCELWAKSLPERTKYALQNPEKHLLAWDAGWYQLKDFWKEKYREDFDELRVLHRALADSMREGVYTYGFLRR